MLDIQKGDRVCHYYLSVPYTVSKIHRKSGVLILKTPQGDDFLSQLEDMEHLLRFYPQKGDRVLLSMQHYLEHWRLRYAAEKKVKESMGKKEYKNWKYFRELEEQFEEICYKTPKWVNEILDVKQIIPGDMALVRKQGVVSTSLPASCLLVYERPRAADQRNPRHLQAVESDRTRKAS